MRFRLGQFGDGERAGLLHVLVDLGRARVQRAAEKKREAQHVVDLVGKSERPVAMMASGRTAFTSSGMISGVGLASAITMGRSAIVLIISR